MNSFFEGFEKRAYEYEWEARQLEERAAKRQHDRPPHLGKAMGIGAGVGGGLGALAGNPVGGTRGALIGGLAGASLGAVAGLGRHLGEKKNIQEARRTMSMPSDVRNMYLKHQARSKDEGRRAAETQSAINQAALMHALLTSNSGKS